MNWRYRADAAFEVAEIAAWYDARRRGYGERFLVALERLYEQLCAFPESGERVPDADDIRRAQVQEFPYFVYYEILDDLEVLCVVHHARHERVWRKKVE